MPLRRTYLCAHVHRDRACHSMQLYTFLVSATARAGRWRVGEGRINVRSTHTQFFVLGACVRSLGQKFKGPARKLTLVGSSRLVCFCYAMLLPFPFPFASSGTVSDA